MDGTLRGALKRAYDRLLSVAFNRSDFLKSLWSKTLSRREGEIPFVAPPPLLGARLALITTAGFHAREDTPFTMSDPKGDPSFREVDLTRPASDFVITHDYYDHRDAEADRDVVFPVERAEELRREGVFGALHPVGYSFMGHLLDDTHIP